MPAIFQTQRFDTVSSTNDLVKDALEAGEPAGMVFRAAEQTGGYGRQGRTWASPRGGLYQSLLLRPDMASEQLATLGLVVALSVRRALLSAGALTSDSVRVKWPNDVVCAQGKLAGVSMEAHTGGICVGIGVNVWRPAGEWPVGGKNTPAYLAEIARNGMDCEADMQTAIDFVGDEILSVLMMRYLQWEREGFAAFADEFNACDALAGRQVEIADRNGSIVASGLAGGVDASGCLLVDGAPISSGEAHIL